MLRYSFIFLFILFTSCGARKVSVDKNESTLKVDSVSTIVKNEVVTTNNNIRINTDTEECEIIPIDSTKPVVIGDKKYFNAKIKIKKIKTSSIDTTKKQEVKNEVKKVSIAKIQKEKSSKKESDRKPNNFFNWLWLLIIVFVLIGLYIRKRVVETLI